MPDPEENQLSDPVPAEDPAAEEDHEAIYQEALNSISADEAPSIEEDSALEEEQEASAEDETPEVEADAEVPAKEASSGQEDAPEHDWEKRWRDTRRALNERDQKIAELEEKFNNLEQSETKEEPPEELDPEVAENLQQLQEDNPGLPVLVQKEAKRIAQEMLEAQKAELEQRTQEQEQARKKQDWANAVDTEIDGGMDLYFSPEFVDWENSNKARLNAALGHYQPYDPQCTIEEIRMFQKEKGLVEEQELEKKSETQRQLDAQSHAVQGRSTPNKARRSAPDPNDEEQAYKDAVVYARQRQKERSVALI